MTRWLDIFSHSCSWNHKPNQLETKIQSQSQHLWKTLQKDLIVSYGRPSPSGQALNAPPRLWQPIPSHHHLSCFPCQSRCQVLLVKGHKWKVGFSLILLIFLGKKERKEKRVHVQEKSEYSASKGFHSYVRPGILTYLDQKNKHWNTRKEGCWDWGMSIFQKHTFSPACPQK